MTQEEKFKEAKRLYETANADQRYVLESLFPELRESEDERIRKELIKVFTNRKEWVKNQSFGDITVSDILAWLERQAQKPNPVLGIEIPFGTKDSELQEASYHIPEGFYAEIEGNRVVIKRGEQKPADKVEPKFKVGDKIVENNEFGMIGGEITDIDATHYELNGGGTYIPISRQDNYRLVRKQKRN